MKGIKIIEDKRLKQGDWCMIDKDGYVVYPKGKGYRYLIADVAPNTP